ncbi:mucin-2-like [Juglans microcarpa x Juglans regia]|uniref:mucin-2-like n=1 Tax=Juglans microcarpa x Juglans regia TaxID=2249226 RepID=UPI001B7DA5BC|nr:mucin-2-like [Juglans microcarpa x Juglans regia]
MSNQPTQPRPLFRLPSIARSNPTPAAPAPAPAPAPATVPEPRPVPLVRSTFRPLAPSQPTQSQEPAPPPSTATRPVIPAVASPPPPPAPPSNGAPVPAVATTRSVPSSPTGRVSAPSASVTVIKPTSSVPSSPQAKVAAPSSSVPTSPVDKAPLQAQTLSSTTVVPSTTTTTARVPTPIPPSKTISPVVQTTPKSPKPKPTAPPPSPLILPPSQLKSEVESEQNIPMAVEQKTVLIQKTIDKPKPWLGGNGDSQRENGEFYKPNNVPIGKEEVSKEVQTKEKKEKSNGKKNWDSEEMGMRVITIAGENKGAFMELIQSPKKHEAVAYKKGNHKTQSHGSESESMSSSSDKEGNPKREKGHKGKVTGSKPMSAFMNSNVQSVNNSILYNCSCTHHDPGVHLSLSRKPSAESYVKDRVNGNHT